MVQERTFPWFAIRVRSRHEKIAAAALRGRGYEEYTPLYRVRRRWTGHSREVELVLFPGYVFCRFNPMNRLPILTTPGVADIVGFGKRPCPVPDSEITAIRRALASPRTVQPWPFPRTGQRVRIEDGPLFGLEGIVVEQKGRARLILSVTLLQRSVAVEVDRECIRVL